MPKKTKRKTGDTFIFTTSKAMGKRIREHCAKTSQPVGPWIRSVVAREVSPNLPRQSWSYNDQWKDEIYKIMAEDVTPERERKVITRTCDGRVRIDKIDATGLLIEGEFVDPDKITTFEPQ